MSGSPSKPGAAKQHTPAEAQGSEPAKLSFIGNVRVIGLVQSKE